MKLMFKRLSTIALVLALFAPMVLAKDYWYSWTNRPWQRGDPGTTYQMWEFTQDPGPTPTFNGNPYGTPTVVVEGNWPDNVLGPDGTVIPTWHISGADGGSVTLTIPNTPNPNWMKQVFVQITADKGSSGNSSIPSGSVTSPALGVQHQGNWYTYNWLFTIHPNPPSETITFIFPYSTNIEEIVVDTRCVTPEPATYIMLGTGLIGLLKISRKRK
jgi:hypothetical protein